MNTHSKHSPAEGGRHGNRGSTTHTEKCLVPPTGERPLTRQLPGRSHQVRRSDRWPHLDTLSSAAADPGNSNHMSLTLTWKALNGQPFQNKGRTLQNKSISKGGKQLKWTFLEFLAPSSLSYCRILTWTSSSEGPQSTRLQETSPDTLLNRTGAPQGPVPTTIHLRP